MFLASRWRSGWVSICTIALLYSWHCTGLDSTNACSLSCLVFISRAVSFGVWISLFLCVRVCFFFFCICPFYWIFDVDWSKRSNSIYRVNFFVLAFQDLVFGRCMIVGHFSFIFFSNRYFPTAMICISTRNSQLLVAGVAVAAADAAAADDDPLHVLI